MTTLHERLAALSPKQRAELAVRLGRGGTGPAAAPSIPSDRRSRFEPFPLTDLQRAYWMGRTDAFLLGGIASRAYLELESAALDLDALEQAWNTLIGRHDMLRAVVDGDGMQRVLESVPPYRIERHDLRTLTGEDTAERLDAIHEAMFRNLRDPGEWPLFDLQASLLPGGLTRVHVVHDLLNVDGGSIAILFQELGRVLGDDEPAAAPTLTFRDYVVDERRRESTDEYRRARQYWLDRMDRLPPAPSLPLARPPSAIHAPRFRRHQVALTRAVSDDLRAAAQRMGVSPTAVFLTAYAEVLGTWSDGPRFTVNVPLFNRAPVHPQVNEVVGVFTTVELLEVDHTVREHFADRARRIQRQLIEDLDHRQFDGVRVQRELARRRGPEHAAMPVVFTSLLDHRFTEAAGSLGRATRSINQTAQVWMDLHVDELDGCHALKWDAVEGLFPDGLVEDMLDAYRRVLEGVAAGHAERVHAGVRLVPDGQRARRDAANDTAQPVAEGLAHQLLERHARERPQAVAVVSGDVRLTFGDLNARANRLAHRLRAAGARPDELVAVVMEKGWEQVVAVMAVLKAGAAYAPIDPEAPPTRLAGLLAHASARLAVTQPHLDGSLEWPPDVRRFRVEDAAGERGEDGPIEPVQGSEHLAYVLYTSGSTGEPKGVMIEHRSVVNRMTDVMRRFGLDATDRVIAITALHHDLSVFDLFGGLGAGATLVIPDHRERREPSHWARLVAREGVTTWNSVPAFMQMLVEYLEGQPESARRQLDTLERVVLSGDWIPVSLPDRLRALAPHVDVIGAGGPTETTVWDICFPIAEVDASWKSIPYGRPMINASYHVLDTNGEERPDWVAGEMYIGGVGLARGFWRDPDQTRARFIRHAETGERLYRSGDVGRWRPDGVLEFVGRMDLQVKVQGQRIELGEIENALVRHPGVSAAAVTVTGDDGSTRSLVGYVVCEDSAGPDDSDLRDHLATLLPPHMIPATWVRLDELPLSRNGKVDRGALPLPDRRPPRSSVEAAPAARGPEARLSELVRDVLGVEAVEPSESLLAYGANSIDLVRLGNRLEREFGQRPRIDELFRLDTVRALAHWYAERQGDAEGGGRAVVEPSNEIERIVSSFDVLLEPADRDAFKESEPGIRRDVSGRAAVSLERTDEARLGALFAGRAASRSFSLRRIPLARLSQMLECFRRLGPAGKPKYAYASAGAQYPNQVYLHVRRERVEGLEGGTYYYHPGEHSLVSLSPGVDLDRSIHIPFINQPVFDEAAFSIFIVARLAAIAPVYGDRAWHFSVLEAGLMGHALEQAAAGAGIGLCHIGTVEFEKVRELFQLDDSDVLVHSLVGGLPGGSNPSAAGGSTEALLERISELSPEEVRRLLEAEGSRGG